MSNKGLCVYYKGPFGYQDNLEILNSRFFVFLYLDPFQRYSKQRANFLTNMILESYLEAAAKHSSVYCVAIRRLLRAAFKRCHQLLNLMSCKIHPEMLGISESQVAKKNFAGKIKLLTS